MSFGATGEKGEKPLWVSIGEEERALVGVCFGKLGAKAFADIRLLRITCYKTASKMEECNEPLLQALRLIEYFH